MGPLTGVKVVELSGIGPGPFCGMLLSDMGAEVVRVRTRAKPSAGKQRGDHRRGRRARPALHRGRPQASRRRRVRAAAVEQADALIEGFRPASPSASASGPTSASPATRARVRAHDRLGPGRAARHARGHDINYIALAGALAHIGRAGAADVPPLNLVGDFGGGGMFLAFGSCAACSRRDVGHRSGRRRGDGRRRGTLMRDGSRLRPWASDRGAGHQPARHRRAPSTTCTRRRTPKFDLGGRDSNRSSTAELLRAWDSGRGASAQMHTSAWPALKERFAAIFKTTDKRDGVVH
jgi:alpha-methylacyl-CoA racemase